jgi:5-methylcytosine-specific restriction endonuclease McrA
MRDFRPKRARIKLLPEAYRELHRKVLDRDNWQCQICGSRRNLQVHHRQFRSQSGDDCEDNLIALCDTCHSRIHLRVLTPTWRRKE